MRLLKIGRDSSCDVVLNSNRVSSLHAEMTLLANGDILLEDKGSSNGTLVAGQPLMPGKMVRVKRGDAVRFADMDLSWGMIPMPEDNSMYSAVYGVGSSEYNDIRLQMGTVSRFHATVKVGKDGKVYIVDHSTNGTTVNGTRIAPNAPREIKKSDIVMCSGALLDLAAIKWPAAAAASALPLKKIGIAVACVAVLVAVIFGITKLSGGKGQKEYTDAELFARYSNATVMLRGIYHYEITFGRNTVASVNKQLAAYGAPLQIPEQVLLVNDKPFDLSNVSLLDLFGKDGIYTGTGFFVSDNGQFVTNLHVVSPWLFEDDAAKIKDYYIDKLAYWVALINNRIGVTWMSSLPSQIEVKGVLDYIALVPNGEVFDPDNIIKCRVLSAGTDTNIDIALGQTITGRMPTPTCTYVNVKDSLESSDEALIVGEHVYTIGFSSGTDFQDLKSERGILAYGQDGKIAQEPTEYKFGFNAEATHGASGSPIFNKYGMLIGVLNSGWTDAYNYGIKGSYVKDLIERPHRVE